MSNNNEDANSVMIERTIDAPVDLVWKMWTEAEHFKSWYGPQGAAIPKAEMDATVGGSRHICMQVQTPNGEMTMWFVGEYKEVNPPTRLVYTESLSDEQGNIIDPVQMGMPEGHPGVTEVVVELEGLDNQTKLKMSHIGVPADSPGAMGWNMALDKLAVYVTEVAA